jgi:hypothetical protein
MTMQSFRSDIAYVGDLVEAGWNGAIGARRPASTASIWAPAAVGAIAGALSASFSGPRRSRQRALTGSVLGAALGLLWGSRAVTAAAARGAARKVNTVRDAHWLEKHPIAYA